MVIHSFRNGISYYLYSAKYISKEIDSRVHYSSLPRPGKRSDPDDELSRFNSKKKKNRKEKGEEEEEWSAYFSPVGEKRK